MKVLVTGGTGFIGSYLVEELVRLGHVVRVATRDPSNLKWVEHLRNEIEVVKCDVTRVEEVRFAVRGVDVVYHLAAIFRHGTDEGLVWRVNYLGTKNVANEVLKEGCRLIHVSTVGVLGPANDEPLSGDSPLRPNPNPYSRSKAKAEEYVRGLSREGLEAVIARPAFAYGPRSCYGLNLLVKLIIEGKLKVLIGSGNNYIHPIHARDIAKALITIANKGGVGEAYIVANEELIKLRGFVGIITEYVGTKVRFGIPPTIAKLIMKLRGGGIGGSTPEETIMLFTRNWFYRIDKLKSLGWKQTIPLSEGLKETIEWLRIHHNITM